MAFATFCDVSGAAVARQDPTIAPTQRPGTPKTIIGPKGFVGAATFGPSGFKYDENPPLEEWNVINPDGSFRYGYVDILLFTIQFLICTQIFVSFKVIKM